jgi:hypothetical protein
MNKHDQQDDRPQLKKGAAVNDNPKPIAMLGGINGVALVRHIEQMTPSAQTEYHTPLYDHPLAVGEAARSKNLEADALYQLLASGKATPEDQQWAANGLRDLHGLPRTGAKS